MATAMKNICKSNAEALQTWIQHMHIDINNWCTYSKQGPHHVQGYEGVGSKKPNTSGHQNLVLAIKRSRKYMQSTCVVFIPVPPRSYMHLYCMIEEPNVDMVKFQNDQSFDHPHRILFINRTNPAWKKSDAHPSSCWLVFYFNSSQVAIKLRTEMPETGQRPKARLFGENAIAKNAVFLRRSWESPNVHSIKHAIVRICLWGYSSKSCLMCLLPVANYHVLAQFTDEHL